MTQAHSSDRAWWTPTSGLLFGAFVLRGVEPVARLNAVGVPWLVEVEGRPVGLFATFLDRQGSYVQVIEFNQDPTTCFDLHRKVDISL